MITNYLKILVIPLVFVFAFPLILAILNLFGVFSTKLITIIFFGIIALYSGYKLGKTVSKRGFIHGLALGVILSLFMFVFSLLFHNHYQFNTLIYYYASKGINLNLDTFKDNLGLLTIDGKYNLLAQLLSDNSHINVRVAILAGKSKADPMFSVKEFGMMNLLLSLDKVLDYGDTFNIPQADERHRIVTRKEVSLFDANAYREAIINAFVHNDWKRNVAPMFTFYSDRIEILSHGALSPKLTIKDFYKGKSEPRNKKLSDIFVQLHISERTGRGVPTILNSYGEKAFEFANNWIQVTIPFNFINAVDYQITPKVVNKSGEYVVNKSLSKNQIIILKAIRNNPNITIEGITRETGLGHTAIQNNLNKMQDVNIIKRIGSRKNGYWEVLK